MERLLENLIPFFAIGLIFGIPIIAILTAHQRKMAEMIHGNQNQNNNHIVGAMMNEIAELRREVAMLRDQVNRSAIETDGLRQQLSSKAGSYSPSESATESTTLH